MKTKMYNQFFGMLFISLIIMYVVMFLNVDEADDIYLSLTRLYMSLLMMCPMALTMLFYMRSMYQNRKLNQMIISTSILVFIIALFCLRSQTPVNDQQYMKAMIPHHSSAIMTSKHANIQDPEVRALADSIIRSQRREIVQMKSILNRMK